MQTRLSLVVAICAAVVWPAAAQQVDLDVAPRVGPISPGNLRIPETSALRLKPDIELLFQARPELRDVLQRYPMMRTVKPQENSEFANRFPDVTVDMLEALQHFERTGLPKVLRIDPATLPQRFLLPVPDHTQFFQRVLAVPNFDPSTIPIGPTIQIVPPGAALSDYYSVPEAQDWLHRVRDSEAYDINDVNSCTISISALLGVACEGEARCDIEAAFGQRCLGPNTSRSVAEDCVLAVDAYRDLCLGNSCAELGTDWPAATLVDAGDPFCSAALIDAADGSTDETLVATVAHCSADAVNGSARRFAETAAIAGELGSQEIRSHDINPAARVFSVPAGGLRNGAALARPERFAETMFVAYNQLIALRNQVIARFGLGVPSQPPLICDGSPLCTIVELYGDGRLHHTCQSTRGGSGGALVQFPNGIPTVVGLNEGADEAGLVKWNLGIALAR